MSSPLAPAPALPCKIEQQGCLQNSLNILNKFKESRKYGIKICQIETDLNFNLTSVTVFMMSQHFDAYGNLTFFNFAEHISTNSFQMTQRMTQAVFVLGQRECGVCGGDGEGGCGRGPSACL